MSRTFYCRNNNRGSGYYTDIEGRQEAHCFYEGQLGRGGDEVLGSHFREG